MLTRIWKWVYPVLIIGLIMVGIVFLGSKAAQNAQQIGAEQAENHSQDKQITSLSNSLTEANSKLQSAGLPTVPVIVQPSSGENGRNGDDGRSVLSVTCGAGGVWTVVYDDGTIDTAGGGCIGQPGSAGAAGQDGKDSTVPGPQGQAGQDGATVVGPQGSPGVDGRGISSFACQDDGTWLVTYTDSTTQVVQGPCKSDVSTPSETPPPSTLP